MYQGLRCTYSDDPGTHFRSTSDGGALPHCWLQPGEIFSVPRQKLLLPIFGTLAREDGE